MMWSALSAPTSPSTCTVSTDIRVSHVNPTHSCIWERDLNRNRLPVTVLMFHRRNWLLAVQDTYRSSLT
jgi:hypothetical protein